MGNDNIAFRSSFRGYNKKDVYKYLESLNREIIDRNEALTKKLEASEKHVVCLENEIMQKDSALATKEEQMNVIQKQYESSGKEKDDLISELSDQVGKDKNIIAQNNELIAALNNKITELETEVSSKDALIDELDHTSVSLSIEIDGINDQYRSLESKYEELSNYINLMKEYESKANAYDRICSKIKAHTTRTQFTHNNSNVNSANIKNDIDNILSTSASELLEQVKITQAKFNDAITDAQNESDALKEKINQVINSSKERIISQLK